jgi:O-antigen/teichoic acid export membrane protein
LVLQFSFAEIIIKIIANPAYLEGINFALPLAFLIVLEGSSNISSIGIELEKKTYLSALITLAGTITAIVLIFPLTKLFSAVGIAYALLLSKIFTTVLRIIISARISPLRFKMLIPYAVLILSFLISLISINLSGLSAFIFRLTTIVLMSVWLAAVLMKLKLPGKPGSSQRKK